MCKPPQPGLSPYLLGRFQAEENCESPAQHTPVIQGSLSSRPANTLQQGYLVFVSKEKQNNREYRDHTAAHLTQLPQAPLFPLLPSTFDVSTTFGLFVFFTRFRGTKKLRKKKKQKPSHLLENVVKTLLIYCLGKL